MYISVDDTTGDNVSGYCYTSKDGEIEKVSIDSNNTVSLMMDDGEIQIYVEDIPKLIKALNAALNHIEAYS